MSLPFLHNPTWAKTPRNIAIELYQSELNPHSPLIVIGGVHGDEPEGVELAKCLINWLHKALSQGRKPQIPWIIIPCINPDGYRYSERCNSNKVDLNRNFPSSDWSAQAKEKRYNPGPKPNSELETQALVQLFKDYPPKLIIHCHSWHPGIIYTGAPALPMAKALSQSSGYKLKEDIGYPTPGSLGQYGWHDLKVPVICIEEQENSSLSAVWPHFEQAFEKIFFSPGSLE